MNCDNCMYAGICKYEERARKFEDVVQGFAAEQDIKPECLTVLINCNKFKRKYNQQVRDGMTVK